MLYNTFALFRLTPQRTDVPPVQNVFRKLIFTYAGLIFRSYCMFKYIFKSVNIYLALIYNHYKDNLVTCCSTLQKQMLTIFNKFKSSDLRQRVTQRRQREEEFTGSSDFL